MVHLPTEFRATLESYRGPLDLLLYLIRKEELDIFDVPISRITEQYLVFLQILKDIDPNICGEFLVTAAQLMEIKSKTLLPVEPQGEDDEEMEDPRLELVLQLLEYKKYKERALLLERLVEQHNRRYRRPAQDLSDLLPDGDAGPLDLGSVSVWDLLTAFQRVQLTLKMRQPHRVLFEDRPIEEYIRAIEVRLERAADDHAVRGQRGAVRVPFEDFFEDSRNRYEAVGFLLAILEMAKQGALRFHQDEVFGPIELELVPVDERVPAVEEPAPVSEQAATDAAGDGAATGAAGDGAATGAAGDGAATGAAGDGAATGAAGNEGAATSAHGHGSSEDAAPSPSAADGTTRGGDDGAPQA